MPKFESKTIAGRTYTFVREAGNNNNNRISNTNFGLSAHRYNNVEATAAHGCLCQ